METGKYTGQCQQTPGQRRRERRRRGRRGRREEEEEGEEEEKEEEDEEEEGEEEEEIGIERGIAIVSINLCTTEKIL